MKYNIGDLVLAKLTGDTKYEIYEIADSYDYGRLPLRYLLVRGKIEQYPIAEYVLTPIFTI